MKYYKVKPEYDQKRVNPNVADANILVANELFTEKERSKMPFVPDECFEEVLVKKTSTYIFFGARFESKPGV